MSDDTPEMDADALEHVTEANCSAARKVQLERYEPVESHTTLTVDLEGLDTDEKKAEIERVKGAARAETERELMERVEQQISE